MAILGTYCGQCCFCEKEPFNCKLNLLDTFTERGAKVDKENLIIDRICPYKRPCAWNIDKSDEERIQLCQDDVYISGTIVLIANKQECLEKTILKLNQNDNIDKFMLIVIYSEMQYSNVFNICGNNIRGKYRLVHAIDKNINMQILKSLSNARNGYLFILDSNFDFDDHMIDKVNHVVNKKLFRLLHIPGSPDLHQSVSMIHLYKYIKGDLQCPFREKIIDIAGQENSDTQILTWEQINAEYSN